MVMHPFTMYGQVAVASFAGIAFIPGKKVKKQEGDYAGNTSQNL